MAKPASEQEQEQQQDDPDGRVLDRNLAPADDDAVPDTAALDWAPDDPVVLQFGDLLPDAGGEVVADLGGGLLELQGEHSVVATGTSEAHVTASGYDVSGLSFFQFDNGITLYVGDDTSLTVSAPAG